MKIDFIEALGTAEDGSVYVKPAISKFPYIYREAAEVHWDTNRERLYGPVPRDWSQIDWIKHILVIAMHHGTLLRASNSTEWMNVGDDFRTEISAFDPTTYLSSTKRP